MNTSYGITEKFQVTIPKEIRDALNLTNKHRVQFERRGDEVILKKLPTLAEVSAELQADLKRRGFTKVATQKDIDNARSEFYRQGMTWE